jgi:hypothetical protein
VGNVKFSGLPVAPTVSPADGFAVVQGGVSKFSSLANLWEATPVGNANYTILSTDVLVTTSVAFTLPRSWTLPSAASYGAGRILRVVDSIGTITGTNTLTIARAGTDLINGATSQVLSVARAFLLLVSDGVSNWTIVAQSSSVFTGNSYQAITVSAAGNTNSNQSASIHYMNVTVAAGAGVYTGTLSLPRAGRIAGDSANILLTVAASTNPKIQVFDNTTGGTKLFEFQGDGVLTQMALVCVYTGTVWYLHDAHFFN